MHSSHDVHFSNQSMKCSTRVALYNNVKCFWKGVNVEEIYVKKMLNFRGLGHNVLIDMSKLLAQRRWKVALDQSYD